MFGGGESEDANNFKEESDEDEFNDSDEDFSSMNYSSRGKPLKRRITIQPKLPWNRTSALDNEFEDADADESSGKRT